MSIELLDKYKVIFFDLDDTIYPEIEYLKRAYNFIAETVVKKEKSSYIKDEDIYNYLIMKFKYEGRNGLYQKICTEFNITNFSIDEFLYCMRFVNLKQDDLETFPAIQELLKLLIKKNKLLFIITNGNEIQQRNKLNSLNIPVTIFKEVIFSSMRGKEFEKPNPYFLNKIITDYSLKTEEAIFIGDSEVDKQASERAGISFLDVSFINAS